MLSKIGSGGRGKNELSANDIAANALSVRALCMVRVYHLLIVLYMNMIVPPHTLNINGCEVVITKYQLSLLGNRQIGVPIVRHTFLCV